MKPIQVLAAVCTAVLAATALPLQAQKLNNIQEAPIWAPANVKIDARLNDWDNTLQAYNKTIGVNYILANDEKNIYLVVKATDPGIANKIIAGGIDLIINTEGKKAEKNAYVVSFPLVDASSLRNQMSKFRSQQGANGQQPDSAAIASMRQQAVKTFKEIKLKGFKDIADSVLSIYNEYGIKAAADYDDKGSLVCELAIPLKYFSLNNSLPEFAYNIRLNGLNIQAMMMSMMGGGAAPPGAVRVTDVAIGGGGGGGGGGFAGGGGGVTFGGPGGGMVNIRMSGSGMGDLQNMTSPTDFWAKYKLAAKK